MKNAPADCHAAACDGKGHVIQTIEASNVPASENPCLAGSCTLLGAPDFLPVAAGNRARCAAEGGTRCDGEGHCVPCLSATDCPPDEVCTSMNTVCAPSSCTDGLKGGD